MPRFLEDQRDGTLYDWGKELARNPNLKEVNLERDAGGAGIDDVVPDDPQPVIDDVVPDDPQPVIADVTPEIPHQAPKKRGRPPSKMFTG